MNGGTIRKLYWVIIPLGYLVSDTVNQDFEADEWTASRMRSFGRSKRESLAFLVQARWIRQEARLRGRPWQGASGCGVGVVP